MSKSSYDGDLTMVAMCPALSRLMPNFKPNPKIQKPGFLVVVRSDVNSPLPDFKLALVADMEGKPYNPNYAYIWKGWCLDCDSEASAYHECKI